MAKTEITLPAFEITEIQRQRWSRHEDRAYNAANVRIFGALDVLVPELMAAEPFTDRALFDDNPEDVADLKVWKAWRRKTLIAGKKALVKALEAHYGVIWIDPADIRFSDNAGCSGCPCSPGFLYKGPKLGFDRRDLHFAAPKTAA